MGGWYVSPVEAVLWCAGFVAGSILFATLIETCWFRWRARQGRKANQVTFIAHDDDWSD